MSVDDMFLTGNFVLNRYIDRACNLCLTELCPSYNQFAPISTPDQSCTSKLTLVLPMCKYFYYTFLKT